MNLPRFVLAGTQSGVGKTTISIGIMAALKRRGLEVQPFKVGPDYIDPAFHSFVTGNKSRNLDGWMLKEDTVKQLFVKNAMKKDVAVVEGVMGLYDGRGNSKDIGSTAHISKIIKAPVLLVINGKGMSASAAAQVLGYKVYDTDVDMKGAIINNVSGDKHYELLKEVIERDTGIRCFGYLKPNDAIQLHSRHLGLVPSVEVEDLKMKIDQIAQMVEETIDLDGILKMAKDSQRLAYASTEEEENPAEINIGVPYDRAFNFYYEDNLDLLRCLGANLVFFSPLEDQRIPENLHGLYIGGGFPEVFGKQLEKNKTMRDSIKKAIEEGIPTYAECGGLMYLTKAIKDLAGNQYDMVGIFDTEAAMTHRLQRFGYVDIDIQGPCPIALLDRKARGHEFHRSLITEGNDWIYTYQVRKNHNMGEVKTWPCGLKKYNTLAAYAHIHFYSNKELARDFIKSCKVYKLGEVK
ncbi:MAG: cobyrinate a,c-diamide synthase [Bacillota bacterium]